MGAAFKLDLRDQVLRFLARFDPCKSGLNRQAKATLRFKGLEGLGFRVTWRFKGN